MVTTLRPSQAVKCPLTGEAVFTSKCQNCDNMIDVRSPWRHYAVKCRVEGESTGVYP